MPRKPLAVLLALGLVVAHGAGAPLKSEPAKPAAETDLAGKLVIVTMKGEKNATVLGNIRVKRLGSREFLVGEYAGADDDVPFEATYWLPLEQVDFLMECKDKEAVRKVYGAKRRAEDKE